jgi:hypothetical protein
VLAIAFALAVLVGAQSAFAQAPYWRLSSRSAPTNLPLAGEQLVDENDEGIKGEGMIVATATNFGDANVVPGPTTPITVTDQLPEGVEPLKVRAVSGIGAVGGHDAEVPMKCEPFVERRVVCTFEKEIPPFEHLELEIRVKITLKTKPEPQPVNKVTVAGGQLGEEVLEKPLNIVGATTTENGHTVGSSKFGVEAYEFTPESETGQTETQAGSHPFQVTTTFNLNQVYGPAPKFEAQPHSAGLPKDLAFKIPAGFLGNATVVPQCTDVEFGTLDEGYINSCPDSTAIGVANVTFNEPVIFGLQTWSLPVFNLTPAPGEPAKFGFEVAHTPVVLDTSVRTGEDYGVTVRVINAPETVEVLGSQVTLWGVPGDPRHDNSRGWNCIGEGHFVESAKPRPVCTHNEFPNPQPFLLLPTACPNPLATEVSGESWPTRSGATSGIPLRARNEPPWASGSPVSMTGCEKLAFEPSLTVKPDTSSASTPTGMTVEVNMPQKETTLALPPALGEADIKDTTLALPLGVEASAGAANGLDTCGLGQTGLLGEPLGTGFEQEFTPGLATCPDAAKVGEVEVNTPLLPHPVTGGLFLGTQNTNPFQPPLVLYLIASEEEPIHHEGSKVLIKLAGEVRIESNGQLVSSFRHTPQAPFERLRVHLFGGGTASQSTPAHCGTYTAKSRMVPWSEGEAKEPSSSFQITSGPGGGPCPSAGPLPLGPVVAAGPASPQLGGSTQAGVFSPFELMLERPDGQQALTGLTVHLPQGAAAKIASVTPCTIARADAGTCGPESLIGEAITSSGLGGVPVSLKGQAFLTESFGPGKPFGVSVLTDATHVGPFNIGTIIANSTIEVDPYTAAATITLIETRIMESTGHTTIDTAPDVLPTRLKGVPVQLKTIRVDVNQKNFEFNPTRCSGRSITGAPIATGVSVTGAEGGGATSSAPYAVTGCDKLEFAPKLTAAVSGQGSKENGVTFAVTVESRFGEANIAKTFLTLPIALPSRLTTIQKACLLATFEQTFPPGQNCGEGSHIGDAIAHTPVLKQPLKGPAYLISHGSEAFPDVEFVLQGEGITVVLDGKTDVKKGITYSRFETVPDAPVETFETIFPAGPHSALTANVPESEHFNLCKHASELVIPTEITGQNGAVLKQNTQVQLLGCPPTVLGSCTAKKGTPSKACLAIALAECRKKYKGHSKATKKKRASCEARARKAFGPHKKKSKHHKTH